MRVLLLDTAFAAAPIYDYLIECGYDVWVMGNREADFLAKRAHDRWIAQDYSDVPAVQTAVNRVGIDYVVPGCTDISLETRLRLAWRTDLVDAPDVNDTLSNKRRFREVCAKLGLPSPEVVELKDLPRPGLFISKPVDSFSGRGVTVFDGTDRKEAVTAYQTAIAASPSSKALIEHFVKGDLYSCSAFVEKQRLTEAFYVLEGSSANPYAVDTSYVAGDFPEAQDCKLRGILELLCNSLRLQDGLLHCQFILGDDGPKLLEVSRRCPGDLYPLLIEYSTGFKYAAKYASYFVGASYETRRDERRHVLRHTISAVNATIFGGLRFRFLCKVLALFPLQIVGQDLLARQGSRAGVLFAEFENYREMRAGYARFLAREAYAM